MAVGYPKSSQRLKGLSAELRQGKILSKIRDYLGKIHFFLPNRKVNDSTGPGKVFNRSATLSTRDRYPVGLVSWGLFLIRSMNQELARGNLDFTVNFMPLF